jgi:hypothetical protein
MGANKLGFGRYLRLFHLLVTVTDYGVSLPPERCATALLAPP